MESNLNSAVKDSWKVMANHLQEDMTRLLENEKALIRFEMNEKISQVKSGITTVLVAGSLLILGGLTLVATSIIVLDQYMSLANASAIVTAVLLSAGSVVFNIGKNKLTTNKLN
jgi:hypothetical protein